MKKNFFLNRKNPGGRNNNRLFVIIGTSFKIILLAVFIAGCAKDVEKDQQIANSQLDASIAETFPSSSADTVFTNSVIAVTFKSTSTSSEVAASTIILKQGTTSVSGTVSYSGTVAIFTPSTDLSPETSYTATIKSNLKSGSGKSEKSWSFKTGRHRQENELSIVSVIPLNTATSVSVTIQPSATFKNGMELSKIKALKFTVKQGAKTVPGTKTYSGKTVTFKPAGSLAVNTLYTVTISSKRDSDDDDDEEDEDDHDGDEHRSDRSYSWSFTTGGGGADVTAPTILSAVPANNATGVAISAHPEVIFSEAMNATTINTTNFTLKQGTTAVAGTVTFFGATASFLPSASLKANTVYTASVTTGVKDAAGNSLASIYLWSFTTAATGDIIKPTVLSVIPANNTTGVANSIHPSATFSEAMNATTINTSNFTLKQGTTAIAGTVAYSGTTATFTPSANLLANTVYTVSITTGAKDVAGNAIASNYAWSFTTTAAADVTPPKVITASPINNATGVANSIHPAVTFSEAMNATTINSTNFTLKKGGTSVAGIVSYSGISATFTPSASLLASTVYTASITTGVKDIAGNALTTTYSWNFTTAAAADVTSPTVTTVVPASNATSVAVASNITANFSEAMNASTITSTTFTLKQGTIAVAGLVSYSGTAATFNPAAVLAGNTVYTATITTGAKDLAGNAITTSKVWSFTTVAVVSLTSWSTEVWPIISSKCTPCHGTSGGSAGVNMGNYAQVSAMSNSAIDNPGMYSKLGVSTAQQAIIKSWIAQGKLNN